MRWAVMSMLSWAVVQPGLAGEQERLRGFKIEASFCEGDPLASRDDGKIKVESWPRKFTLEATSFYKDLTLERVGSDGKPAKHKGSIGFRLTPRETKEGRISLVIEGEFMDGVVTDPSLKYAADNPELARAARQATPYPRKIVESESELLTDDGDGRKRFLARRETRPGHTLKLRVAERYLGNEIWIEIKVGAVNLAVLPDGPPASK
jgi:hypothetical protein